MERLGSNALGPLQYIDDLTAACPSLGALRAVLSNEPGSACSRYASKAKAAFNYGPNKTAAMALYGAPLASDSVISISLANTYRILGTLVDDQLSFKPYLCEISRRRPGRLH